VVHREQLTQPRHRRDQHEERYTRCPHFARG
jgi:hypothetical protein